MDNSKIFSPRTETPPANRISDSEKTRRMRIGTDTEPAMNRDDAHDPSSNNRDGRHKPARDERVRDPYEAHREVRTFNTDDEYAAQHPWDAAHPASREEYLREREPDRGSSSYASRPDNERGSSDQPERGRRAPTENSGRSTRPDSHAGVNRDDAGTRPTVYGSTLYGSRHPGRDAHADSDRPSSPGHDGAADRGHGRASSSQQRPDLGFERNTRSSDESGAQMDGHADSYGSAGYAHQGKRYAFDGSGDNRGRASSYRGVGPRNYARSDERLLELINEHLTDADLDARDIDVKAEQGVVTLEGSVPARWMRHHAENVVDACGGVKDIHNQLRVGRPAERNDSSGTAVTRTPVAAATPAGARPKTESEASTGDNGQREMAPAGNGAEVTRRKH